jgi:hypothetical protein
MTFADDPHLVERIARLAVFHDLPTPVVVQMTLMASELLRRPAGAVHEEVERRVAHLRAGKPGTRTMLHVVSGGGSAG